MEFDKGFLLHPLAIEVKHHSISVWDALLTSWLSKSFDKDGWKKKNKEERRKSLFRKSPRVLEMPHSKILFLYARKSQSPNATCHSLQLTYILLEKFTAFL